MPKGFVRKIAPLNRIAQGANFDLYGFLITKDEDVLLECKSIRDIVVFTSKKVIAIDIHGLAEKKKEFLALNYSRISAYSVESDESWELDAQCKLWASGIGRVEFEFMKGTDVREIASILANKVK